jgi:chromosomal replication initiator protein
VEREIELTAEDLWHDVSARLRDALNDTTYSTWFGDVHGMGLDGDRFVLTVPNDFTREWIEGHFLDLIRATVRDVGGSERRVSFVDHEPVPPPPFTSQVEPSS